MPHHVTDSNPESIEFAISDVRKFIEGPIPPAIAVVWFRGTHLTLIRLHEEFKEIGLDDAANVCRLRAGAYEIALNNLEGTNSYVETLANMLKILRVVNEVAKQQDANPDSGFTYVADTR